MEFIFYIYLPTHTIYNFHLLFLLHRRPLYFLNIHFNIIYIYIKVCSPYDTRLCMCIGRCLDEMMYIQILKHTSFGTNIYIYYSILKYNSQYNFNLM